MKAIDFSKPIRHISSRQPREYIGPYRDWYVVADEGGRFYKIDEFGRMNGIDPPRYGNIPVIHKRTVVLYTLPVWDKPRAACFEDAKGSIELLTKAGYTILAQKEVKIEE